MGNKVFVRIDPGEEIVGTLTELCKELQITAGTISGIGATDNARIGLFDVKSKTYHSTQITGDHEIAPVFGNISVCNGEVYLHVHVNLCDAHHHSFGGHLSSAVVSATFEAVIEIADGTIHREFDESSGLNLQKF